ncbi:uncharacterized protein B0I36DRAFT_40395 [Microdochium trichocladiopsis]|uniref:Autophagy-related protein 28 n=1 Tax=Microdochium trichocladiopsis TaxID=1682393 RepID=A0A9P8XX03_9PEZI|nr:uncharacterized protein B0I36DRAFT_40395 [Microdochium trichocladiopsis]KAH7018529.1 hypothetical protein B0I36DRAFT_40395 [Microdochium trichocladiopsis]
MAFARTISTDFPRSQSSAYDLDELSPRPDDSLLSPAQGPEARIPSTSPRPWTSLTDRSDTSRRDSDVSYRSDGSSTTSDNKGKLKAIANAYPSSRRGDPRSRMSQLRGPDLWKPPFASPSSQSPSQYQSPGERSWIGGILRTRPFSEDDVSYAPAAPQRIPPQTQRQPSRAPSSDVDTSFTVLRRREHDITRQIQYYLNQQEKAHESSPMGQITSGNPARDLDTQAESQYESQQSSYGHVVPVRQPKKGPISLRRARNGITNSIAMMADLKSEEDAQIAEAVALRKKALAKLQGMQSRMSSIDHDLSVMQDTTTNPARKKLREKRERYTSLCNDIKDLEEQLRQARLEKGIMERQMEELQSKLDSDLSGYQGAKKECEQSLRDLMGHPGVPALDVADLGFKEWHELGFKFLEQPRSKRRPDMAKEWWEGDLRYLEEYRDKLERERAGLEEGGQLWIDAVAKIIDYEQRLSSALGMGTEGSKSSQWSSEQSDPKTLLLGFYTQMQETIRDLEATLKYAESEGMTLLVAAIGAEVVAMQNGQDVFANLIKSQGWELPAESRSSTPTGKDEESLLDMPADSRSRTEQEPSQRSTQYHDANEELSGSVIRRWEEPSTASPQPQSLRGSRVQLSETHDKMDGRTRTDASDPPSSPPAFSAAVLDKTREDTGAVDQIHDDRDATSDQEEDDNEVPAGLLSELHLRPGQDSDDERNNDDHDDNAVPKEFLSMHDD